MRSLDEEGMTEVETLPCPSRQPPINYECAYFPLTPAEMAEASEKEPFDIVIIGSGMGGGVLAGDLLRKSRESPPNQSHRTAMPASTGNAPVHPVPQLSRRNEEAGLRILIIERGGLPFITHCLNGPRPTKRGTYGQMNDWFYNIFKDPLAWDTEVENGQIWKGGPVIASDTLRTQFPEDVENELQNRWLRKAEELFKLSFPQTQPVHRELMDRLNLYDRMSGLPTTQWEWARVASEFKDPRNFDFPEGAFSSVDVLVEAAMDHPGGDGKFNMILNTRVSHLEPKPKAGTTPKLDSIVVEDQHGKQHRIKAKKAVLAAGSVESPAILLRSRKGDSTDTAYGKHIARQFGHVTDHYVFGFTSPFYYCDPEKRATVGAVKLQSNITFDRIDNLTALANISFDAASFLPRRNIPDRELPQFIITYILPSALAPENNVEFTDGKTILEFGYADDPYLEDRKKLLVSFTADVMNKIADVLDIRYVLNNTSLKEVKATDINLRQVGPGGVAHELGSIPMPGKDSRKGVVDSNLKLKCGWEDVYVCDLSVFPYSPAANPSLSLAALALRLSDHLTSDSNT